MKQILIISSAENVENKALVDQFANSLNKMSNDEYNCTNIHYDDIGFEFGERIRVFSLVSGVDLSSYDFVYFKSYIRYEERAYALATVLKKTGVHYLCTEVEGGISMSKLSQYALLAAADIPLPKTLYIPSKRLMESYDTFVSALGLPFVIKAADGKGGEANYLIKDRDQYSTEIGQYSNIEFVGQSFIANTGDLRVLVVNDSIKLIIARARLDDTTHLNNTSQGASARLIPVEEFDVAAKDLSLKAARAVRREIAGVDIMFEKDTNRPYILEVNASPQVGSGAFTDEKLLVYRDFFVEVLKNTTKGDIITS